MKTIILLVLTVFIICIPVSHALIIEPEPTFIVHPVNFSTREVKITNDENVTRKVLLYIQESELNVICFIEGGQSMVNMTLLPNETKVIHVVYFVLPETPSREFICNLGHVVAYSERMTKDIDEIAYRASPSYQPEVKQENHSFYYLSLALNVVLILIIAMQATKKLKTKKR